MNELHTPHASLQQLASGMGALSKRLPCTGTTASESSKKDIASGTITFTR
jgi:hypothetical protein